MINAHIEHVIQQQLDATTVHDAQVIQRLWSGCGKIIRVSIEGGPYHGRSVVLKHVEMPKAISHPRGWNTDRSMRRKARSYQVEAHWYDLWSERCGDACRVPACLAQASWGSEQLLIMEDIDASGFGQRITAEQMTMPQLDACIAWLASFHATFLGHQLTGLWENGTYWHLDTRPDEYEAMPDTPLKHTAQSIDRALDASPFQTLLHGDAKLANFCFSEDGHVAAIDFQYVGGGCGMKDLAYLVGSALGEQACFDQEARVLDRYFHVLRHELNNDSETFDLDALERDWRRLYPYAWADFERFLQGWSPGHWKIDAYSKHMTELTLADLDCEGD